MAYYLTTFDNPYDPETNFDEWLNFDLSKGYNSCVYLDKILGNTDLLSDTEKDEALKNAILYIVDHDMRGIYVYVTDDLSENSNESSGVPIKDPKTGHTFIKY